MLTSTVQCLLRFPLMGCVNKNDKKLLKGLPKRIKKIAKKLSKENKKPQKVKTMCKKLLLTGTLRCPLTQPIYE